MEFAPKSCPNTFRVGAGADFCIPAGRSVRCPPGAALLPVTGLPDTPKCFVLLKPPCIRVDPPFGSDARGLPADRMRLPVRDDRVSSCSSARRSTRLGWWPLPFALMGDCGPPLDILHNQPPRQHAPAKEFVSDQVRTWSFYSWSVPRSSSSTQVWSGKKAAERSHVCAVYADTGLNMTIPCAGLRQLSALLLHMCLSPQREMMGVRAAATKKTKEPVVGRTTWVRPLRLPQTACTCFPAPSPRPTS